ncbi:MAG TPA: GAF domain-containing protein, partial [Rubrivivax sp.]|nr:GAF domain-containing protein [Rubrivivax sp.]
MQSDAAAHLKKAVTDALAADGFKLNEVLRLIMRTMLDSLGVDHIVFCLRDARSDALTGRLGLGKGVEVVSKALKVPLSTPAGAAGVPDLFAAVCRKGADTLIADATAAGMAERLPSWYRQQIGAPWFLLLPVTVRGSPFGLLYLDAARPHAVELGDKELALLRTLRNQVSMAFRQAEGR